MGPVGCQLGATPAETSGVEITQSEVDCCQRASDGTLAAVAGTGLGCCRCTLAAPVSGVVVGFDARHNSLAYAKLAAAVFASAGVKVRTVIVKQCLAIAHMHPVVQGA